MNYDSIVKQGSCPWLPNGQAADLDSWHTHDVPLIGTFSMAGGKTILFTCLAGFAAESSTVWAYLCLSENDLKGLEDAEYEKLQDLQQAVAELFIGKTACFAYARHSQVIEWSTGEVDEDGVLSAVIHFMDNSLKTDHQRVQAHQARVDATMKALEPV